METRDNSNLTEQQKLFCLEYIRVGMIGAQAARKAGYSKKSAGTTACILLKNPDVKLEISKLQREIAKEAKIDAVWVLEKLIRIVDRCMEGHVKTVCGRPVKKIVEDDDGNEHKVPVWTFDSAGANRALELIGKHLGMFTELIKNLDDKELTEKQKQALDLIMKRENAKQSDK